MPGPTRLHGVGQEKRKKRIIWVYLYYCLLCFSLKTYRLPSSKSGAWEIHTTVHQRTMIRELGIRGEGGQERYEIVEQHPMLHDVLIRVWRFTWILNATLTLIHNAGFDFYRISYSNLVFYASRYHSITFSGFTTGYSICSSLLRSQSIPRYLSMTGACMKTSSANPPRIKGAFSPRFARRDPPDFKGNRRFPR